MGEILDPISRSIQETKADYVRLGKSGLQVSVPIFGTMGLGSKEWLPWVVEEDEALPLLKAAYDRGINTWDTANVYSNGVSEELIGKAIKRYAMPRERLVILTKCFSWVGNEPGSRAPFLREKCSQSKDFVNQGGLSRKAIFSAVDASLHRMGLEYIDLLQIHRFDPNTPIEETMEALHDLVKAGKVRYIGASSMWTYQFAQMQFCAEQNGWTKFISMQCYFNLLYREEEREMIKFCKQTGVGVIPWGSLCRGHLARPLSETSNSIRGSQEQKMKMLASGHSEADQEIIKRVHGLAGKKNWSMTSTVLAWMNKKITSPIIGFSSEARLDDALAARGRALTLEEEKYLEEPYVPRAIEGHF